MGAGRLESEAQAEPECTSAGGVGLLEKPKAGGRDELSVAEAGVQVAAIAERPLDQIAAIQDIENIAAQFK